LEELNVFLPNKPCNEPHSEMKELDSGSVYTGSSELNVFCVKLESQQCYK